MNKYVVLILGLICWVAGLLIVVIHPTPIIVGAFLFNSAGLYMNISGYRMQP